MQPLPDADKEHRNAAPKKRLGQHFLTSTYHAQRIADAVPAETGATVFELCAGRGALSRYLVAKFPNLHCNEMDDDAIPILRSTLGEGAWALHAGDVMSLDFAKIGAGIHVVGNLPYNIGAHIIKKTLMYGAMVHSCTFMLQREVAERIVAGPGSKKNGFLSIFCQFFGTARLLFHVPPGAFLPKPKVYWSLIKILIDRDVERKIPPQQWPQFCALVDRGFSKRRKTLANSLGWDGDREHYQTILKQLGLAPMVRSEDLGIDAWRELFIALRE
jgi:16S rRNA (adenine1518-N6/adenine1519-N6)-dimethyltransferase